VKVELVVAINRSYSSGLSLCLTHNVEVAKALRSGDHTRMFKEVSRHTPLRGQELISLAQKLARDAERHAILSASLASQADRLMVAGLRELEGRSKASSSRLGS
jgi:hypothetical protein